MKSLGLPHRLLRAASALLVFAHLASQEPSIDFGLAQKYFKEARAICTRDHGELWGKSLCGPMLFVDPQSRAVVANQSDREGRLTPKGDIFAGRLPESENIANTATPWAGVKWTMIMWPLPENPQARARLMLHELYHRIQEEIGVPGGNPSNAHLDTREGRIWLQLEWRALRMALMQRGAERRKALQDALLFRAYRRGLFPAAASEEEALEMNEGLAEYTGVKLRGTTDSETVVYVSKRLEDAPKRPSFVRSFAYETGPAYGLLLDASGANWRKRLKPGADLGTLLQESFSVHLPANLKEQAEKRAKSYDGDALRAAETDRENSREKQMAEYRARLVDGPTLLVPLSGEVRYSFDPNNLLPLGDLGTIYPTLRVTDEWGVLTVSNGALLVRQDGRVARVYVSAPANPQARPLQGDGWTLELKPGWKLETGTRAGDYLLTKIH